MVVAPTFLLGERKKSTNDSHNNTWLWIKCIERSVTFDRSLSSVDGRSSRSSNFHEVEIMDACSIAKSFLVPTWWGSSGVANSFSHHDRLRKNLVLSHGVNGPSARIVLWKNYMGFDNKGIRRDLGAFIRAHDAKGQFSGVEEVENTNQSLLGSMLGTAVSTYVNTQLEHCGELDVHIGGTNRDILRGQLKRVKISAKQVVYKGVSLSDVDLSARSIQIKLGKKSLLQDPLHVKALISICEKDLKASLASPLVADYLKDILPEEFNTAESLAGVKVSLQDGVLLLTDRKGAKLGSKSTDKRSSVALSFDLTDGGKTVYINNAGDYDQANSDALGKSFSVGSETSIKKLGVMESRLIIGGEFFIIP